MNASGAYELVPADVCNMCGEGGQRVLGRRLARQQGLRPRPSEDELSATIVRCSTCGLIFANPMPVPVDAGDHYDVDPEEFWHDTEAWGENYFAEQIASFGRLWSGSKPRALDIGAGLGMGMAAMGRAGFDVVGIELSPSFRSAAIERGMDPERLQLAAIEDADLPAEGFDLVTFGAVLEHLRDPADSIRRALGWTAQGGLIHIEVPSARWLTSRLTHLAYRLQRLDLVPYLSPMHAPFHLYEFTLDSFARLGERVGFEVIEHRHHVASTYLPKSLDRAGAAVMDRTDTGMQLEVWLGRSG